MLGRGSGVRLRPRLRVGEALLRRGLSGQGQPPEVLLHPRAGHEGEDLLVLRERGSCTCERTWVCLQEGQTLFEQELYHSFSISCSRSYFLSFAGDVSVCTCDLSLLLLLLRGFWAEPKPPPDPLQTCQVGLNFASEEEARRFQTAVSELLNRRQRRSGTSACLLTASAAS